MNSEKISGHLVYIHKLKTFPFEESISKHKKAIPVSPECDNSKRDDHLDISTHVLGDDAHYFECVLCDEGGDLICCNACPGTYHLECLSLPLVPVPKGKWKCSKLF
ncbi:Acyl-CoA N-acyltransferase with RING/FYVE/PHD-type zinc finger protein [Quillaja saponaria]|uniref:Acyl-CoA N-acyltransferase with RING/FYVE/PHD-type zinc finger protein n=1 Tax=Quillaja saponaria TaxID=32244 RepID=A0AAD7QIB8_QUISA|nr:Acyl-CoA N-acyltransferase with RING/FYVE/PHD-type zinc finger protein [Quillaja saponaria]KAJ7982068.1 Acyl-CoA N-acyltransferase with RING/FYVE/PHD-type zinc finger protein [Quillaja saponaria]